MPPKASAPVIHAAPSPSPPPQPGSGGNDAQDLLIIQDFMDTLDQIPSELTKVHSDLNELGAVLYCEWTRVLGTLFSNAMHDKAPAMGRGCGKGMEQGSTCKGGSADRHSNASQPRDQAQYPRRLDSGRDNRTRAEVPASPGDRRGGGEVQAGWG
jgi:hypothetical protein